MAKFGDIDEAKDELKQRFGLTDAEIDALDWTIDEMEPVLTLRYPIYWQTYAAFTNGIINYVTQYWQITQEGH